MLLRRFIEDRFRASATRFGYQEVGTPTFENAELFTAKSGPEILEQIYSFRDKGDRELVLRPELTAPVIRFYANELYKLPKPLKVFYFGSCFRYERPQKGRFREFWQFGAELLGTDREVAIAELIAFACDCLTSVGLTNFTLRVGYLEVLREILAGWNISNSAQRTFFTALDKGDSDTMGMILSDSGLAGDDSEKFFKLVQAKFNARDYDQRRTQLHNSYPQTKVHLERLGKVVELLRSFGLDEFDIDLGIARGLDYYTGIVFEIDVASLGAEKQVCGGGEYSLNELFDIPDVASAGFAIGFDRVALAHETEGLKKPTQGLDIFLIPLSPQGVQKAVELVTILRQECFNAELDLKDRNMSKNLKYASSRSAKFVVFIGEDELKKDSLTVRNMATGDQCSVKSEELIAYFKKQLDL